jgi:hypothetical protein
MREGGVSAFAESSGTPAGKVLPARFAQQMSLLHIALAPPEG